MNLTVKKEKNSQGHYVWDIVDDELGSRAVCGSPFDAKEYVIEIRDRGRIDQEQAERLLKEIDKLT